MLSVNIDAVNWRHLPGGITLRVHASPKQTGLPYSIEGSFHVSNNGYVYSLSSQPVLWLKFLGLTTALTLTGISLKCSLIGRSILRQPVSQKEISTLQHTWHLAGIAARAIAGTQTNSLIDSVEEFALAEIDYNDSNRLQEMDRPRSLRLISGQYIAKCIQPLFHTKQIRSPTKLADAIASLRTEHSYLRQELEAKKITSLWRRTLHKMNPLNSYSCLSEIEVKQSLHDIEIRLSKKQKQLEVAEQCHKYAAIAILKQQNACTQALKDASIDSQEEVECCNILCYRHQKICGLLHRIECCATKCWAIDLACCFCCFWPEGRLCCWI